MSLDFTNIFASNPLGLTEKLLDKKVFIAGAGGLGSNVASLLLKAGIANLKIIDFDEIEASNLNRQFYFQKQIGMPKVEALKKNLLDINSDAEINVQIIKLNPTNCSELIPDDTDIIFECFDSAESKAMLTSFCLSKRKAIPLIAVSGIAGAGKLDLIKIHHISEHFWVIGDGVSDVKNGLGVLSTRVMYAATMQAHLAIQILMNEI